MKLSQHLLIWSLLLYAPFNQAYQIKDGDILNAQQQNIQLRGVNWFGFETENYVVHGLWARAWRDMLDQMQSLGFNAVRLPFCPNSLKNPTPNGIDFALNPDLQGLGSLDILDKLMNELDQRGMYILLDHHRPDCQAISELWYTDNYSETDWINDLLLVTQRYQNNPHLLGIDLKNEPHGAATWGTDNPNTDWRKAAERAASALLNVNDNILIFVEGIQENPDCSGTNNHWWGGNLEPMRCYPLAIPKTRLVLSPHVYGPDVFMQNYFNASNFPDNMPAIWDTHFGFLRDDQYAVVLGELGGRYGHGGNPLDITWQNALIAYMQQRGLKHYFYWSWNPNSGDTGGILQDDWHSVWDDKISLLQTLTTDVSAPVNAAPIPADTATPDNTEPTPAPPTEPSLAPTTTPEPSSTPISAQSPDGQCELKRLTDSQWQDGAVWRFQLINHSNKPVYAWQIQFQLDTNSQITEFWSVELNRNNSQVQISPKDWNQQIPPQQQIEFGMKILGQPLQQPTAVQINSPACGGTAETPAAANSDYIAGYQAAIQACQQNPAACGLASQFDSATGGLYIPQIQIPSARWQATLQYVPVEQCHAQADAILFQVLNLESLTP